MAAEAESAFGRLLREWRSRRRVSQLDLAVEAGVYSRHVSFIETGRSQPSREMILMLAREHENHFPARLRAACLNETDVPRVDARLDSEVQLAYAPARSPLAQ